MVGGVPAPCLLDPIAAGLWQVPEDIEGPWGERRAAAVAAGNIAAEPGPGLAMLRSFRRLEKVGSV